MIAITLTIPESMIQRIDHDRGKTKRSKFVTQLLQQAYESKELKSDEATAEFTSRACKSQHHDKCSVVWEGLEIEAVCDCNCHKNEGLGPEQRNQAPVGQVELSFEVSQNNSYIKE